MRAVDEQGSVDAPRVQKLQGIYLIRANASMIVEGFIGVRRCVCTSENVVVPRSSASAGIPESFHWG